MSSKKIPAADRSQGGPGGSHADATEPAPRRHARPAPDQHETHDPRTKS
jgi:hypothetical protein